MNLIDPITENKNLVRHGHVSEKKEINESERSLVAYGSTKSVDSYQESLLPQGWIFDRFSKNPIMPWSHNYRLPPVGKALWWKTDSTGLLFKAQFAETQAADEVWQLFKNGFLNAFSVGYEQIDYVTPNDEEEYMRLLDENEIKGRPRLIGTKQHLWEISPVVLPANADALVAGAKEGIIKSKMMFDTIANLIADEEFAKQIGHTKDMLIEIVQDKKPEHVTIEGIDFEEEEKPSEMEEERGATAFSDLPTAAENESWDSSKARQNVAKWASSDGSGDKDTVNWTKFRKAFFWYDAEAPENFGSYKLPFADVIGGKLQAVWKGVAASMASLLGARGGVNVPDSDRKAIYNHIAKYYKKFDKEVPDFKDAFYDGRGIEEQAWDAISGDLNEIKEILTAFSKRLEAVEMIIKPKEKTSEISVEEAAEYIEKKLPELISGEIRRLTGKMN